MNSRSYSVSNSTTCRRKSYISILTQSDDIFKISGFPNIVKASIYFSFALVLFVISFEYPTFGSLIVVPPPSFIVDGTLNLVFVLHFSSGTCQAVTIYQKVSHWHLPVSNYTYFSSCVANPNWCLAGLFRQRKKNLSTSRTYSEQDKNTQNERTPAIP